MYHLLFKMDVELEENKIYTISGIPTQLGKALHMKNVIYNECIFKGIKFKSIHSDFMYEKQNSVNKPVFVFDQISIDPLMFDYIRNKDGTLKTIKIIIDVDEIFMNYSFTLFD